MYKYFTQRTIFDDHVLNYETYLKAKTKISYYMTYIFNTCREIQIAFLINGNKKLPNNHTFNLQIFVNYKFCVLFCNHKNRDSFSSVNISKISPNDYLFTNNN